MSKKNFLPSDFIKNFTPNGRARLFLKKDDDSPFWEKILTKTAAMPVLNVFLGFIFVRFRDRKIKKLIQIIVNKYGKNYFQSLDLFLKDYYKNDPLRKHEYSFLLSCLMEQKIKKDSIVDFGGGFSLSVYLPVIAKVKFFRFYCVDIVSFPSLSRYGIRYLNADCTNTPLKSESVDLVTIISTLEHVGLGRYGDALDPDGDVKTMNEAKRILTPGGYVVLTVPYGEPAVIFNLHRIYDEGRLKILTSGFKRLKTVYTRSDRLIPLSRRAYLSYMKKNKQRSKVFTTSIPEIEGGVMMLLRKI